MIASSQVKLLDVACWIIQAQLARGEYYAIEHPAYATSWGRPGLRDLPGSLVQFDQCQVGLRTKVVRTPLKKTTRIKTNCHALITEFCGLQCDGSHKHAWIQGREGGVRRSTHSQQYPDEFCMRVARAAITVMDQDLQGMDLARPLRWAG